MRIRRYSWWLHWRELADFILPRRYRWLVMTNQMNRGSPINQNIIDSTGGRHHLANPPVVQVQAARGGRWL